MRNFAQNDKIKNLRHELSQNYFCLKYVGKISIILEYDSSRPLQHFEGGGMKKFRDFQILLIWPISSDGPETNMDDMCVGITSNWFKTA